MRKVGFDQLELNPFTVIGEDTFLLTAGSSERWNTMTAGWGGLGYLWNEAVAYVFVRQSRYTYGLMESSRMFSLSFFPPELKGVLPYRSSTSLTFGEVPTFVCSTRFRSSSIIRSFSSNL